MGEGVVTVESKKIQGMFMKYVFLPAFWANEQLWFCAGLPFSGLEITHLSAVFKHVLKIASVNRCGQCLQVFVCLSVCQFVLKGSQE